MLYISRGVGHGAFGVVDTDDGVEEVVSAQDIVKYCGSDPRLEINGVKLTANGSVYSITPYQVPELATKQQIKTKLLQHVDVRVFRGAVSGIFWNANLIKTPITIRLSDFGESCWDGILIGNDSDGGVKITLVLDDKIRIGEVSFRMPFGTNLGPNGMGVVFDVREMSNGPSVYNVYQSVFRYSDDPDLFESLLDYPERMKRMLDRHYGRTTRR